MIKSSFLTKSFAAAALTFAGSTAVFAEAPASFVHAGTTYTYVETLDHGKRVIAGRSSNGGQFRLVVGERTVRGTFNGSPVSFRLNEVRSETIALR